MEKLRLKLKRCKKKKGRRVTEHGALFQKKTDFGEPEKKL